MQLRKMRRQLGMSQEKLAGELGVSAKTVYNWERREPPKSVLMLLKVRAKTKSPFQGKTAI
jgi:DNA-binding transcriptional regulator YiaG